MISKVLATHEDVSSILSSHIKRQVWYVYCDHSPGEGEIKGFLGFAVQQSSLMDKSKASDRDIFSKKKVDGS